MTRAQDCRPTLAPKPTRCFLCSSLTSRSPGFLKAKEIAALSWEDNDIYFFWLFFFFWWYHMPALPPLHLHCSSLSSAAGGDRATWPAPTWRTLAINTHTSPTTQTPRAEQKETHWKAPQKPAALTSHPPRAAFQEAGLRTRTPGARCARRATSVVRQLSCKMTRERSHAIVTAIGGSRSALTAAWVSTLGSQDDASTHVPFIKDVFPRFGSKVTIGRLLSRCFAGWLTHPMQSSEFHTKLSNSISTPCLKQLKHWAIIGL